MTFSENSLQEVRTIIARYPEGKQKSALIPVLHLAQQANGGWLSTESMDYVATLLQISPIEVYEVATFYSMYHVKPVGKYVLEVCRTGPCCLRGAENIISMLEKKLNIKVGGTSEDGLFTLKTVECLASCGTAPMMMLGYDYYENLTEQKLDDLLSKWKKEAGGSYAPVKGSHI